MLLILELFVLFSEPFDTAGGIYQFLFSGKKRMAFGTNFYADILLCGSHMKCVAADALNGGIVIIRMDVGFHFSFNPPVRYLTVHGLQKLSIIFCSVHFFKQKFKAV